MTLIWIHLIRGYQHSRVSNTLIAMENTFLKMQYRLKLLKILFRMRGAPQTSVLGRLLFNIFTDDIYMLISRVDEGLHLQSVTKIVRLAPPAPLFNVGCKFAWSFLAITAWLNFPRLGRTLNHRGREIIGIFEQV